MGEVSIPENLLNRRVSVRVLDNADFSSEMTGKVVRIATEHDFQFRLPRGSPSPLAILVRLDRLVKASTRLDCPASTFNFALLLAWDVKKLVDFVLGRSTTLSSTIHFYLLNEEMLRQANSSPERDELDITMTYGISKDVEISLLPG